MQINKSNITFVCLAIGSISQLYKLQPQAINKNTIQFNLVLNYVSLCLFLILKQEIMTLILDSTSAKKISLLKELALQLGVKVTETPTKTRTSSKSKTPNETTLKSMAKTDSGIGLTKANNAKDMMEQIFSK